MTGFTTARELAARGFSVFPIAAGAKAPPLWFDWPSRSTATTGANWPDGNYNVGIHCVGLLVLDVDLYKAGGQETLLAMEMAEGELPTTLSATTPRGGLHLFFRLPEGHPGVPNSAGKLGPGVDSKSTGGYVVGAGSETADGVYQWRNPDMLIARAPQWLIDRLGTAPDRTQAGVTVPDADTATVERATAWLAARPGAVEGQGGDAFTFATAAFLRDYGLSPAQTFSLMQDWNARCSPPWGMDDLWAKVVNAYSYATGTPGAKAVTADDFPDVQEAAPFTGDEQRPTVNKRVPIALSDLTAAPAGGGDYIIKGVLYRASYAMIDGATGEGKTFVALDIAYHVAAGLEWMGRRVRGGPVLYIGFEAYGGLGNRARALRFKYSNTDVPLYFTPGGFNLRTPEGRRQLGEILAQLPGPPALVVLDTFAYALGDGDENSAQDVGAFNSAVQALIERTGACVLIIHHTGKDETKGARGSSALPAALDTELAVADRTITTNKQREVELGEPIGFTLTPVMIGMDEDDDSILSCVVDGANVQITSRPTTRRGTNEDRVLAELIDRRPTNEPITYAELMDFCAIFLPSGDAARRRSFSDAIRNLRSMDLIELDDEGRITRKMQE